MRRNVIETIIGAVVLIVAAAFLVFAFRSADIKAASGYMVTAEFDRADDIGPGTDVRVSGVKVGSVVEVTLDTETYLAVIHMSIDDSIELPTDTVATITSSGLLGSNYLALGIGADDAVLGPNDRIRFTQSTPSLEQLLGQVIFSLNNLTSSAAASE